MPMYNESPKQRPARIALVNMPFARTSSPSIQCGLLKAILTRAGHTAHVYYPNMELARLIGPDKYEKIADGRWANALLGEWLFSSSAFGYRPDDEKYLAAYPNLKSVFAELDPEWVKELRKEVLPEFIASWTTKVAWDRYDAVGFTSTFVQNNAAFALARSLKTRFPSLLTMFGGANFDGDMGMEFLEKLEFIDCIVNGEGEQALLTIADRLSKGESLGGIAGVSGRRDGAIFTGGRANKIPHLDTLPEPDYNEYFDALGRLGEVKVATKRPALSLETARGCWWGERQHCTFCGLNASDMAFRAKSPERVLAELRSLTERYQTLKVEVVDNIISMKYLDTVCKPLIDQRCDYEIFWEVKSNLTPRQLSVLANAGVKSVQPGIESLSSHVLQLMRKGVTMLKNVRFLKWSKYFQVLPSWNFLVGFPGETERDYAQQARIIPLLKHLQPPLGWGHIWLERFSPYFFDPSFPVQDIKPAEAYDFIYPSTGINASKVAYYFEYKMGNALPLAVFEDTFRALKEWKESWPQHQSKEKGSPRIPWLAYRRGPGFIQVMDEREKGSKISWFYNQDALLYDACCETDRSADALSRSLFSHGQRLHDSAIEASLKKFCDLGLMIEENGHYLSLALPVNRNWFTDNHPVERPVDVAPVVQPSPFKIASVPVKQ